MTHVHAGLPIKTPHGVGVVVSVRHDGMVVTKLAANGGAHGYTGYFHPSVIGLLTPPGPAEVAPAAGFFSAGMFQPVSPMDCGGFKASHTAPAAMAPVPHPPVQHACRGLERPCTPPPNKRRRSGGGGGFAFH